VWQDQWSAVDEYVSGLLAPHDPALKAALESSEEAGLPEIQVSPSQGKLLNLLAKALGAGAILEFGALGGYSTIWLARALTDGGRLVTLEADTTYAEVAQENIENAGLAELVDLRVGADRREGRRLVGGRDPLHPRGRGQREAVLRR
jgi:predicted O-methyltransferase YrrM